MLRLIKNCDFPSLKAFLRSKLPSSITVLQLIKIEENFNFGRKVFVSSADPKLFVFATQVVSSPPSFSIFWDREKVSQDELIGYLRSIPEWNWNDRFVLSGLDLDLADQVDDIIIQGNLSRSRMLRKYSNKCFVLELNPTDVSDIKLLKGFRYDEIKPQHIPFLFENWKFSKGENIEEYQDLLKIFPSSAIYEDDQTEDDNPLSWMYFFSNGYMGMMFTVPTHRRLGLASAALVNLCKKLVNSNVHLLVQIELENETSIKLHQQKGFKIIGKVCWNEYYPDIK